ncbi:hypothetical protein ACIPJ2_07790 [Curtobacterium sp. NPDC090217]|uniref:hypothetical protein n=1 Tax=Curtobacterium sp. NPDC090217 TaxID=3363970 RepID=UPI00382625E7
MKRNGTLLGKSALCAFVVAAVVTGCSTTGGREPMTAKESRSQAESEFKKVVALAPGTWPDGVPTPVPNDCTVDGGKGVQFTYFVEADAPEDPKRLANDAKKHWTDQGYELTETEKHIDEATGAIYAVVAKADGKPSASMSASKIRAHVYVNSICVPGDPDEYR